MNGGLRQRQSVNRRAQRGLSLIELMISLLIGMVVFDYADRYAEAARHLLFRSVEDIAQRRPELSRPQRLLATRPSSQTGPSDS